MLLSVFGKIREESVHLLFSVRAVPENSVLSGVFPDQKPNRAVPDLDLEVAGSLLSGLGSRLKSVRSPDDWKDQYYEIDQRIADPAPVGVISAEDLKA